MRRITLFMCLALAALTPACGPTVKVGAPEPPRAAADVSPSAVDASVPPVSPRTGPTDDAPPTSPSPNPQVKPAALDPEASGPEPDETIPCRGDADCPVLACGPCEAGARVSLKDTQVDCYMNPCTQSRAVCHPEGRCVVHPLTRGVSQVKAAACVALLRDRWPRLCRDREGADLEACDATITAALAEDREATCLSARAALTRSASPPADAAP